MSFYTDFLGFAKKTDMPVGEFRWLTVVSSDAPNGVELLLEPNASDLARAYQSGFFEGGMPAAVFEVGDIHREYERLTSLGVRFRSEPIAMGPVTVADFEDTCGNLIQIAQG